MVEVLAEEKGQQLGVDGDASIIVSADRLILRQGIVNLLDNAIKYSPKASQISVRIARGTEALARQKDCRAESIRFAGPLIFVDAGEKRSHSGRYWTGPDPSRAPLVGMR